MTYTVRCTDCPRSELVTWLPRMWRERCIECATTTARNHLVEHPGHRVDINTQEVDEPVRRRKAGTR